MDKLEIKNQYVTAYKGETVFQDNNHSNKNI